MHSGDVVWNPLTGKDEARMRVRIEPALRFEEAILVSWGLCVDGHTNADGRPSPLAQLNLVDGRSCRTPST